MSNDSNVIRSISWRDLCPWLIIFRTFTMALNPNILILAFAGVILSFAGWFLSETIFVRATLKESLQEQQEYELLRVISANASTYRRADTSAFRGFPAPTQGMSLNSSSGVPGVFWDYVTTFQHLFSFNSMQRLEFWNRMNLLAYFLFGGLWMIAAWSVVAGAITRIAVLRFAREEGCGLVEAVKFALTRFVAYFTGPILPMTFVMVLGLLVGLFCLFMLADWGVVLVGIFWVIVLLLGFLMAFLLIGLLLGWPLMWPTISAESSDAFDSISRCYAYVLQRPLNYVWYLLVSVIFGAFCWWLVNLFGEQVIAMSDWSASWGAGTNRINEVSAAGHAGEGTLHAGANIISFWNGALRTVVAAYTYGLFWCLATAAYLLLRKDVDETEFDEIFIEGEEDYGLPSLTGDSSSAKAAIAPSSSEDSEDVSTDSADQMKDGESSGTESTDS